MNTLTSFVCIAPNPLVLELPTLVPYSYPSATMFDEKESVRQKWTAEQLELASKVHVPMEEWTDDRIVSQTEHFRLVSLGNTSDADVNMLFGGVDVSFPKHEADPSVAVYVIVDAQTMKVVYEDYEHFHLEMPYIPTFLAFREIAPLERLVHKQMTERPELAPRAILVDGNGILHPRGAGIACFVGVRTGIPTIGIGKTLYCMGGLSHKMIEVGVDKALIRAHTALPKMLPVDDVDVSSSSSARVLFDQKVIKASQKSDEDEVANDSKAPDVDTGAYVEAMEPYCRGLAIPLAVQNEDRDETVLATEREDGEKILACALVGHGGHVEGTKHRPGGTKNPIFVSIGHGLSLRKAVEIATALSCARIPEPVRQADLRGRELLRKSAQAAIASTTNK